MSAADTEIITTSQRANFSLFRFEEAGWTRSVVEFREEFRGEIFRDSRLVTVRNSVLER